jgi:hypothetical protein
MKTILAKTRGWTRVTIAISALWLLISNFVYFSGVGGTRHFSLTDFAFNSDFPQWQLAWSYLTFNLDLARSYEINSSGWQSGGTMYSTDEYRFIGHLLFMLIPLVLLWLFHFFATWVMAGFRTSNE